MAAGATDGRPAAATAAPSGDGAPPPRPDGGGGGGPTRRPDAAAPATAVRVRGGGAAAAATRSGGPPSPDREVPPPPPPPPRWGGGRCARGCRRRRRCRAGRRGPRPCRRPRRYGGGAGVGGGWRRWQHSRVCVGGAGADERSVRGVGGVLHGAVPGGGGRGEARASHTGRVCVCLGRFWPTAAMGRRWASPPRAGRGLAAAARSPPSRRPPRAAAGGGGGGARVDEPPRRHPRPGGSGRASRAGGGGSRRCVALAERGAPGTRGGGWGKTPDGLREAVFFGAADRKRPAVGAVGGRGGSRAAAWRSAPPPATGARPIVAACALRRAGDSRPLPAHEETNGGTFWRGMNE
ncbi:hypothetical protein BU14_0022s0077 [Porphyra umbilicalis]|uniref:Uncharacterized protein n=1 Tax=Porphyra umbilicalis TaxID=2786 RepID=A0A1X6PKG9_PORUM|nr:hypothetical protein BU14_0022s0077 [Porphyra umbilicalis]|eukprot:OSX81357.1 hypothetical protein BU14_0022s0077 [Porphyra umbilicalis]